jgi:RNA polymerase sigma factor (sigma-70 family)
MRQGRHAVRQIRRHFPAQLSQMGHFWRRSGRMADLRARDDAWLLAAKGPDTFRVFYECHVDALIRYFGRRGLDPHDGWDLVQETFIAALEARHSYRASAAPARAWLFGIARNKLADRARAWGRDEAVATRMKSELRALSGPDLEEYARITADDPALQALEELPEDQREALRAKVIEEQDYKEIAEAQGITEANARQRVTRGRRLLRGLLGEERE